MTDYYDGKWHGWNGYECPVHLDTVIEAVWAHNGDCRVFICMAYEGAWSGDDQSIVAFRVITKVEV